MPFSFEESDNGNEFDGEPIDYAAIALQGSDDDSGHIVVCPRHGLRIDLLNQTPGLPEQLQCDGCLREFVRGVVSA